MSEVTKNSTSTNYQTVNDFLNVKNKLKIPIYRNENDLTSKIDLANIWFELPEDSEDGDFFEVSYKNGNSVHKQYVGKNLYGSTDKFLLAPPDWDNDTQYIDYWADKNGKKYNSESIISIRENLTLTPHFTKRSLVSDIENWDISPGSGTYTEFGQIVYNKIGKDGFKILEQHFSISTNDYDINKPQLVNAAPGLFVWASEYVRGAGSTIGDYNTYYKGKSVRFGSKDPYNPSVVDYYWQDDNISINFETNPSNEILTWTGIKFKNSYNANTIYAGITTIANLINTIIGLIGTGSTKYLKSDVTFQFSGKSATIQAGQPVFVSKHHSGGDFYVLNFGNPSWDYGFENNGVALTQVSDSWSQNITYSDIEFK